MFAVPDVGQFTLLEGGFAGFVCPECVVGVYDAMHGLSHTVGSKAIVRYLGVPLVVRRGAGVASGVAMADELIWWSGLSWSDGLLVAEGEKVLLRSGARWQRRSRQDMQLIAGRPSI